MAYHISSGQVSSGIYLNYDSMHISSGGTANSTTLEKWGSMYISSGGVANSTTVYGGGWMYISSGGVANSTMVYVGSMSISSGGTANSTTVYSDGMMRISSGGVANDFTLKVGGRLGGFSFNEEKYWSSYVGGITEISDNVMIVDSRMLISSGGVANSTTVNDGEMYIFSGGVANSTTVYGGNMYISSGGVANSTTVNWRYMWISSGGVANSTTVNRYGDMYISSGGVANSTTVDSGGYMYISSGGTALEIKENGGNVYVADGANVTFTSNTISGFTLSSYTSMTVHKNTIANSTTVNDGGYMYIFSGGVANNTTVNYYGEMYISSGGTALEIVENGGYVNVADGANVTFASNTITGLTLSNTTMTVHKNTIANSTTVDGGSMFISSGGVANSTTVDDAGCMYISSGGTANSTTVNDSGYMYISSGGKHTDSLQIESGAIVSAYQGAVIDFTVAERTVEDSYLINNLSLISGAPTYTITVSADQEYGTYKLAQGASNFNSILSIGTETEQYGYITVNGDILRHDGNEYKLQMQDGNLTLEISTYKHYNLVINDYYYTDSQILYNPTVNRGGEIHIVSSAAATEAVISGRATVESRGKISDSTVAAGGIMYIDAKGSAENITINSLGNMYIGFNAEANSVSINGGNLHVTAGGSVSDVEIDDGKLYLYGGAILDGVINVNGTMVLDDYTQVYGTVNLELESASASSPMIENMKFLSGGSYTIDVDNASADEYIIGSNAGDFDCSFTITADGTELGTVGIGESIQLGDTSYSLVDADGSVILRSAIKRTPDIEHGNADGVELLENRNYVIQYSTDDYRNILQLEFSGDGIDTFGMAEDTYSYRVRFEEQTLWADGEDFKAPKLPSTPQIYSSESNGNCDLFFAVSEDKWTFEYAAQHQNIADIAIVELEGKNRIIDIFEGSNDANVLVLSDDANGDALFVDDIYSAKAAEGSRLKQIDEIRAGAGDDIIDFTSQRYEYVGSGVKIYGGSGNDVIWAADGENRLFGDAGNDRIVGGSGNDIIVGGIGNDTLHGGGGNDIFTFGGDFGNDAVTQLANGKVTLYFDSEAVQWDEETNSYTDGKNSVTLNGNFEVTVFYDTPAELVSIGAFEDFTSEKIFEDKTLVA